MRGKPSSREATCFETELFILIFKRVKSALSCTCILILAKQGGHAKEKPLARKRSAWARPSREGAERASL